MSRSPEELKQIAILRDAYHAIKHFIDDGTSAARHNLWMQSQVIKAHLLTVEDVSIDRDYRWAAIPSKKNRPLQAPARKTLDKTKKPKTPKEKQC